MKVIIRQLRVEDADISWKWRNDSEVWTLTGRNWNNLVTKEIEAAWIEKVITNTDEVRLAICVEDEQRYVGNIQLTNVEENQAEYHIFIGDKSYWGKGIATLATELLFDYAKDKLQLKKIYLSVHKENEAAQAVYRKLGFEEISVVDNFIKMEVDL
jgi:RimJ/RimL family protein N-acetyltransferase